MMFKLESHITGKVYDLTQENMQAMIETIERLQAEITKLMLTPCKFHAGGVCAISQENQRLQAELIEAKEDASSWQKQSDKDVDLLNKEIEKNAKLREALKEAEEQGLKEPDKMDRVLSILHEALAHSMTDKWIPVSERLPEPYRSVELFRPEEGAGEDQVLIGYYRKLQKGFYSDELEEIIDGVTHWMPLPEPPEKE